MGQRNTQGCGIVRVPLSFLAKKAVGQKYQRAYPSEEASTSNAGEPCLHSVDALPGVDVNQLKGLTDFTLYLIWECTL